MWGVPGASAAGLISYLFQSCANNTAQLILKLLSKTFRGDIKQKLFVPESTKVYKLLHE